MSYQTASAQARENFKKIGAKAAASTTKHRADQAARAKPKVTPTPQ